MSDTFSPTQTQTTSLTRSQYGALRDALEHYYGNSLGLTDSINVDGPWTDINGIYRWEDKKDFNEKIFKKLEIPVQNIDPTFANILYLELTKWEIDAPESVEFKEADTSPVNNTLPNQEVLDSTEKVQEDLKQRGLDRDESNRLVRDAFEKQKIQAEANRQAKISGQEIQDQIKGKQVGNQSKTQTENVQTPKKPEETYTPTISATPQEPRYSTTTLSSGYTSTTPIQPGIIIPKTESKPSIDQVETSRRETQQLVEKIRESIERNRQVEEIPSEKVSTPTLDEALETLIPSPKNVQETTFVTPVQKYETPVVENVSAPTYIGPIIVPTVTTTEPIKPYSPPQITTQSQEYRNMQKVAEATTTATTTPTYVSDQTIKPSVVTESTQQNPIIQKPTTILQDTPQTEVAREEASENLIQPSPYLVMIPSSRTETDTEKVTKVKDVVKEEAERQQAKFNDRLKFFKESAQKEAEKYTAEIESAKLLREKLKSDNTKAWVKETPIAKPSPEFTNLQEQAKAGPKDFVIKVSGVYQKEGNLSKVEADILALNTYNTVSGEMFEPITALKIVETPGVLNTLTDNSTEQSEIGRIASNRALNQHFQFEEYKRRVASGEINNFGKTVDFDLKISDNSPGEGYRQIILGQYINQNVIEPQIQHLESERDMLGEIGSDVNNIGVDKIKSQISLRVGQQIASLPNRDLLSTASTSLIGSSVLSEAGLMPTKFNLTSEPSLLQISAMTGYSDYVNFLKNTVGVNFDPGITTYDLNTNILPITNIEPSTNLNVSNNTNILKGLKANVSSMFADAVSKIKISLKGIKTNQGAMVIGGVLTAFAGVTSAAPLLTIVGGATSFIGISIDPVNIFNGKAFTKTIAAITALIGTIIGAMITSVILPIILCVLCVPIIVALFFFIINSGAYVVPPGTDLTGLGYNEDGSISGLGPGGTVPGSGVFGGFGGFISNPYIGVTKTASPAGPFQNSQLPLTIKYTITITAKKETLTIPSGNIKDICTSFGKNGQKSCPSGSSVGGGGGITVTVGNPVTMTYTRVYDQTYKDSINSNVVTITALVASTTKLQVASFGTSVMIGSPCGPGGSSASSAAMCIVASLNQFKINPLLGKSLSSPGWTSLTSMLPTAATSQLRDSVNCCASKSLQCIGFVSATAGLAYGQGFRQVDACSYIGHAPPGYTYISGTSGIRSGDFFVMNGKNGCSSGNPGHIGVVLSVSNGGPWINCADANYTSAGFARDSGCRFDLKDIAGYLRK